MRLNRWVVVVRDLRDSIAPEIVSYHWTKWGAQSFADYQQDFAFHRGSTFYFNVESIDSALEDHSRGS